MTRTSGGRTPLRSDQDRRGEPPGATPARQPLDPRVISLLNGANFGVIATIGADGAPQTTAVWVDWDGSHLLVATTTETVKYRNVVRDPRVAITVIDKVDPYFEVNLKGRVVEIRADGVATIDRLSGRYYGVQPYPYHKPGAIWVTVVVDLERVRTNK
jgi:PPOX class probable F420-dependent enzyme